MSCHHAVCVLIAAFGRPMALGKLSSRISSGAVCSQAWHMLADSGPSAVCCVKDTSVPVVYKLASNAPAQHLTFLPWLLPRHTLKLKGLFFKHAFIVLASQVESTHTGFLAAYIAARMTLGCGLAGFGWASEYGWHSCSQFLCRPC